MTWRRTVSQDWQTLQRPWCSVGQHTSRCTVMLCISSCQPVLVLSLAPNFTSMQIADHSLQSTIDGRLPSCPSALLPFYTPALLPFCTPALLLLCLVLAGTRIRKQARTSHRRSWCSCRMQFSILPYSESTHSVLAHAASRPLVTTKTICCECAQHGGCPVIHVKQMHLACRSCCSSMCHLHNQLYCSSSPASEPLCC